jgi:hypothetical protein
MKYLKNIIVQDGICGVFWIVGLEVIYLFYKFVDQDSCETEVYPLNIKNCKIHYPQNQIKESNLRISMTHYSVYYKIIKIKKECGSYKNTKWKFRTFSAKNRRKKKLMRGKTAQ